MPKSAKEILQEEMEALAKDIVKEYDRLGLRASGKFEKEIEAQATDKGGKVLGSFHSTFMRFGRGPTRGTGRVPGGSLREVIRKWIDDKRIQPRPTDTGRETTKDQLAFLIARKIHREGIDVPNPYNAGGLVSNVFTPARIASILAKVGPQYYGEARDGILKTLKAA